jgi:hypothetical protein
MVSISTSLLNGKPNLIISDTYSLMIWGILNALVDYVPLTEKRIKLVQNYLW